MSPKPISIQFWTIRELFAAGKVTETIEQLDELGFSGVEGIAPGFTPSEWKRWLDDRGMVMSSYFGPLPKAENLDEIRTTLDALDTRYLVSGFWIPELETVDAIRQAADSVRDGIAQLTSEGYTFALHNHWMEFETRDGRLAIDWLIDELPDLQLELDLYWASNFGEHRAEDMVRRYKDRIRLMHVKDGPLVRDEPMLPLGEGRVNISAAIESGNPDWLIIELDAFDGDMMTAVERSFNYLVENGLGYQR
jgi:sugar phosphate isomerase/epimerase